MQTGARHWIPAYLIALLFHVLLLFSFQKQTPVPRTGGMTSISIRLSVGIIESAEAATSKEADTDSKPANEAPSGEAAAPTLEGPETAPIKARAIEEVPSAVKAKPHIVNPEHASRTKWRDRPSANPPASTESTAPPPKKPVNKERSPALRGNNSSREISSERLSFDAITPPPATGGKPEAREQGSDLPQTASSADIEARINSYYATLADILNSRKRYPKRAQRQRIEGVVELGFVVDRNGAVRTPMIVESSGYPILDKEALAMLLRAAPLPALPDKLKKKPLTVTIPVVFKLAR